VRQFLVVTHRWAGLAAALFLAIAGLTGTVIAFSDDLEAWLNPHLFVTSTTDEAGRPREMLEPLDLRARAERALPDYFVTSVRFHREPGKSQQFFLRPKPGVEAKYDQAFFDPYSGQLLGARLHGESLFKRETVVGFLFHFHYALAIPGPWGRVLFGIIAIVWTLDCMIGLALTFPRGKSFLQKWSTAWKIKRGASPTRLNLDLHRAFGLWLWVVLLGYAWSSVMLNLRQDVYRPVMSTMFRFSEPPDTPRLAEPLDTPALSWQAAAETGRAAMRRLAAEKGFDIHYFDLLSYNRATGVYSFSANTTRDIVRNRGQTSVFFDANTGAIRGFRIQTGEAAGDTISRWLQSLHMAQIWGRPYQVFVALIGLIVTMLSVTGIIVWWKKRSARVRSAAAGAREGVAYGATQGRRAARRATNESAIGVTPG
jgi:uncharacterized iron-regulated membrane protein